MCQNVSNKNTNHVNIRAVVLAGCWGSRLFRRDYPLFSRDQDTVFHVWGHAFEGHEMSVL